MTTELDQIIHNAQNGEGACQGCPAYEAHRGKFVNPGLLNPNAELMFLTMDPSHRIDWGQFDNWEEYNAVFSRNFQSWRGGKKIAELIRPLGLALNDVWLGDSIKCPVDNALYRFEDPNTTSQAFDHCREYLVQEVDRIDPKVIVSLGGDTTERVLDMLFNTKVSNIRTGTDDCGRVFDTDPPVVVSPHWSHGWLDRAPSGTKNLKIVQRALVDTYTSL